MSADGQVYKPFCGNDLSTLHFYSLLIAKLHEYLRSQLPTFAK